MCQHILTLKKEKKRKTASTMSPQLIQYRQLNIYLSLCYFKPFNFISSMEHTKKTSLKIVLVTLLHTIIPHGH